MSTRQIAACLYFANFLVALTAPALVIFAFGWLLLTLGCLLLDLTPLTLADQPPAIRLRQPLWVAGHTLLTGGVFVLFMDLICRRFFA